MKELAYLGRQRFNEVILSRDGGRCVCCGDPATAAHHIIERSLWHNQGYYAENGVSLCDACHLNAECCIISCEQLREKADIQVVVVPAHLTLGPGEGLDKWGNLRDADGNWSPGELYDSEQFQKMLPHGPERKFLKTFKYPRTMHLAWSPGLQNDDRVITNMGPLFVGADEWIVTIKKDGENTTMTRDMIHARSMDSKHHLSRSWVKGLWASIRNEIPDNWRICGENMFAKHSIAYTDLPSYFLVFNIWDKNKALSWKETVEWCELLGLHTVPELYRGKPNLDMLQNMHTRLDLEKEEGYVVRSAGEIRLSEWQYLVAKWVREKHVQTDEHWMHQEVVRNHMRET